MNPTHCELRVISRNDTDILRWRLGLAVHCGHLGRPIWHPGASGPVNAMVVYRGSLYVAGGFEFINSKPFRGVERWDGTNW